MMKPKPWDLEDLLATAGLQPNYNRPLSHRMLLNIELKNVLTDDAFDSYNSA